MKSYSSVRTSSAQPDIRAHIFAVGQVVRRKGGFGPPVSRIDVFRITATLPETRGSLQYRIRSEEERYERVTVEEDLEAIGSSTSGLVTRAQKSPLDQLFGPTSGKNGD
ncbi:MAG: hypothetical protein INF16_10305 [Methylobacterium sp.]|jgi:hypothetical protein|nr:hypothetical protein [Methylobacterium sp.]MCA3640319.1 hypothetical protein [Methylobacterium sp.]